MKVLRNGKVLTLFKRYLYFVLSFLNTDALEHYIGCEIDNSHAIKIVLTLYMCTIVRFINTRYTAYEHILRLALQNGRPR